MGLMLSSTRTGGCAAALLALSMAASTAACQDRVSPAPADAGDAGDDPAADGEETECFQWYLDLDSETALVACPEEASVGETVEVRFRGYGQGCDCGGTAGTDTSIGRSQWSRYVGIHAYETVCDPSLCCAECNCLDSYEVVEEIVFEEGGEYEVSVNNVPLCVIAVLDADGCLERQADFVEVVDYTDTVTGTDALFRLRLSTGRCCEGEPVVSSVCWVLDACGPVEVMPRIRLCEGDCCEECACVDSYDVETVVHLAGNGECTVCVLGDACYTVRVLP